MTQPTATASRSATMQGLVFHGPNRLALEERPRPELLQATDAIVRVTTTTICGTDLHILKGDVPTVADGRILGHEGVGVITEVGAAVMDFKPGDKVLISLITSCGRCSFCRRGMFSHCRAGGWLIGHRIDGTQAEYVRVPFADTGLYRLPPDADEEAAVMLSCILPTGLECGVLNGKVSPGNIVAIIGDGPVGLATLLMAQLYSPAEVWVIGHHDNRLEMARSLGASRILKASAGDVVEQAMAWTAGAGVDVAIEAVGVPAACALCQAIIAPGGRIANVGVHGCAVELHLERLWAANITLSTRLVDGSSTAMLLKMVQAGRIPAKRLISHRLAFAEIVQAYEIFGHSTKERALKVVLSHEGSGAVHPGGSR